MKLNFDKIDKVSKKPVHCVDPYEKEGGWFNVPMEEKQWEIIHTFKPICGDMGRVLIWTEDSDFDFAVEIFCKSIFSKVIFCESYDDVVEELRKYQISCI